MAIIVSPFTFTSNIILQSNKCSFITSRPYTSSLIAVPPKRLIIVGSPFRVSSSFANHDPKELPRFVPNELQLLEKERVFLPSTFPSEIDSSNSKVDLEIQTSKAAKEQKLATSDFEKKAKKAQTSVAFHMTKKLRKELRSQYPHIISNPREKLAYFEILQYPHVTESTMKIIEKNNTLVFIVDVRADKKNIKDAVKKMLNIKPKKVNTSIMPDGTKKAYIMLAPDHNALDVAKKIKMV